jgi:hypothetical protein
MPVELDRMRTDQKCIVCPHQFESCPDHIIECLSQFSEDADESINHCLKNLMGLDDTEFDLKCDQYWRCVLLYKLCECLGDEFADLLTDFAIAQPNLCKHLHDELHQMFVCREQGRFDESFNASPVKLLPITAARHREFAESVR